LLQVYYYVSYLAPLAILSLALQAETVAGSLRATVVLELGVFAALAAAHIAILRLGSVALAHVSGWINLAYSVRPHVILPAIMLTAGFVAVFVVRAVRPSALRWALFLPAIGVAFGASQFQGASPVDGRTEFETTAQAHRFIGGKIGAHTIRFWCPPPGHDTPPFRSIVSTYLWRWNLVNETLPNLTHEEAAALPADTRMVFLVYGDANLDDARAALRQFGLDSTLVAQQDFGAGSRAVRVVLADLTPLKRGT